MLAPNIKDTYGHASLHGDNRVVFNIGDNHYRLVVHISFAYQIDYVKFVGTHAECDRIDPESV